MNRSVLIALDTSTDYCSIAAYVLPTGPQPGAAGTAGRMIVRHELTGVASSTRALPALQEVLDEAGAARSDCIAIAFGAGPGSFTGLRTAAGIAQGLAFSLAVPVVPVGTLLACAQAARQRNPACVRVLAVLDARMDEVYWALYEWDTAQDDWRTLAGPALAVPQHVPVPDQWFALAGNAIEVFGDRLAARAHAAVIDPEARPHAAAIATLGLHAWQAGQGCDPRQALPLYVRDKVALTSAERAAGQRSLAVLPSPPAASGVAAVARPAAAGGDAAILALAPLAAPTGH